MRLCSNCAIYDICPVGGPIKVFGATHCVDYVPLKQISFFDDFDSDSSLFGDDVVQVKS